MNYVNTVFIIVDLHLLIYHGITNGGLTRTCVQLNMFSKFDGNVCFSTNFKVYSRFAYAWVKN